MKTVTVVFLVLSILHLSPAASQSNADIIIFNANVATQDYRSSHTEAIAIAGNKIVKTGSNKEVLGLKTATTTVVDAKGRTVIPGLFDTHLHIIRGGRFYNAELRWDGITSLKQALLMLKEQARRTPKGQWVRVVGGWNEYQFKENRLPTIQEINEATGDVPAFILYLYGKAWLNSAGLRVLNIDGETPNPPGGLIEKDKNGKPTGLLIAEPNAFLLYATLAKLPELTHEEQLNSTLQFMRELNSLGVIASMDAGGGFQNFPDDYAVIDSLHRAGDLSVRLPHYLFAQKKGSELTDYSKWISLVDVHKHESEAGGNVDYYVKGAGENLVADAADFENFLFPRPDLPVSMESNLRQVIELLIENRWPFRLHATYDENISRDLDVLEEVNRRIPFNGLVWLIDHAETVSEKNLQRIKALGGGIAVQHRMAYQGESFIRRYGSKAAMSAPPVKTMLGLGIPVALGTDGTRVASYNPWVALYWLTTGKTVGGTQVMSKENTLTRQDALGLMTHGGYSLIRDTLKGRIAEGFLADLVILSKDYFTVTDEEIKSIRSLLTIVNGKIVYGASDYKSVAPVELPVIPSWSPVKYYGSSR